ncbi:hypothetical protein A2911_02475 [Candidatus Nomurabacteria bacterium RIFCSPLOWO2_01_FULL_40_15]|uniref:Uncharacterized protein n=1 Tax=Candidatus Nomurabacteria bacterium RIFCSPLOWO2_01_FULL_40_15 TaxID=1801772 RepID=A0A1F6X5E1_9BACT|nr:MAG: hypothetical protein A2911_02475 [Candidatus Nomurabacteria bacterium RIFCSPLOWO2_01_FULL_40_15]
MDPESQKLLEENLALSKENNEMLHSIRRSMRMARFMSILYWVFIIGSAVGAFYLIQPYIEQLKDVYSGANSVLEGF